LTPEKPDICGGKKGRGQCAKARNPATLKGDKRKKSVRTRITAPPGPQENARLPRKKSNTKGRIYGRGDEKRGKRVSRHRENGKKGLNRVGGKSDFLWGCTQGSPAAASEAKKKVRGKKRELDTKKKTEVAFGSQTTKTKKEELISRGGGLSEEARRALPKTSLNRGKRERKGTKKKNTNIDAAGGKRVPKDRKTPPSRGKKKGACGKKGGTRYKKHQFVGGGKEKKV